LLPQLTTPPYSSASSEDISSSPIINSAFSFSDTNDDNTEPLPSVSSSKPTSSFPKGFPQRPPELEGIITLLESHEEPKRSNGVADVIFSTFVDIIWAIPGGLAGGGASSQTNNEKEKMQITRIRIRTANNEQRDVRFEGRLTGVNIAQGDQVSFWGKERKGLLAFQQGYNHTTSGPITTSKTASPRSGFLLLLVALVGAALFFYMIVYQHL